MNALNCIKDEHIPQWNYIIKPTYNNDQLLAVAS